MLSSSFCIGYAGYIFNKRGLYTREASLDKISFSLASGYQLELLSGLGVGTSVHFSDLEPHLLETHAIPLDAATVPECIPTSILLCLGGFVSLMSSFPSDS